MGCWNSQTILGLIVKITANFDGTVCDQFVQEHTTAISLAASEVRHGKPEGPCVEAVPVRLHPRQGRPRTAAGESAGEPPWTGAPLTGAAWTVMPSGRLLARTCGSVSSLSIGMVKLICYLLWQKPDASTSSSPCLLVSIDGENRCVVPHWSLPISRFCNLESHAIGNVVSIREKAKSP